MNDATYPLNSTLPDPCRCEDRCPCCGKLRAPQRTVVIYPPVIIHPPYQPPLYWWQPGGSPTCANGTVITCSN